MRTFAFLFTLALFGSGPLTAQTPVDLTGPETNIWEHITNPRAAIHGDLSHSDPFDQIRAQVTLEVVVSPDGRVLQAHGIGGPAQFYEAAESIERTRRFTPFTKDGHPVVAKIKDYVSIVPPENWLPEKVPFPEKTDLGRLNISLKRTRCYGTCPAYTVSVDGSGLVQFTGDRFVLVPGYHKAHISREKVEALVSAFRKADFLSAEDRYTANVTDMPSQTIDLRMGDTVKTVVDYDGIHAGMPDVVRDLENEIDETTGTKRWVKGDDETTKSLMAEHWNFSGDNADNMALFRSAIERKDQDLIEAMLRAKAPVDIADEKRREAAPICVATSTGNSVLVEHMFAQQPAMSKSVLQPCLSAAANNGNVTLLDFWIDKGARPEGAGNVLWNGILSGNATAVGRILEYPVDVHERFNDEPLLDVAVERARDQPDGVKIVGPLLKAGASPSETDARGNTPLFFIGTQQKAIPSLLSLLIASGAAIDVRNNNGDTPLIRNAFLPEAVRALLAAGANPTLADKQGKTAQTIAIQFGCAACAKALEEAEHKWTAAAGDSQSFGKSR